MTRQELFAWCMDQYGTEPEYPWKQEKINWGFREMEPQSF